jgi:hypothetical protein
MSGAGKNADKSWVKGVADAILGLKWTCSPDNYQPSRGWPVGGEIELDGFTYDHLPTGPGLERGACWWWWWLTRNDRFSNQPYVQLASVMTAHGDQYNAAMVQYFGRSDETRHALKQGQWFRWLFLVFLFVIAGYGIGPYMLIIVLLWLFVLTVVGVGLIMLAPAGRQKKFWWCVGASFARVLPGIEITKEFSEATKDRDKLKLEGWQIAGFFVIAVLGWILGIFLVGAVTGLIQHS